MNCQRCNEEVWVVFTCDNCHKQVCRECIVFKDRKKQICLDCFLGQRVDIKELIPA